MVGARRQWLTAVVVAFLPGSVVAYGAPGTNQAQGSSLPATPAQTASATPRSDRDTGAAGTLRVDEKPTSLRLHEDHYALRLIVRNEAAATVDVRATAELLDPYDEIVARGEAKRTLASGLQPLDVALTPGTTRLSPRMQELLLQCRLRYRVEAVAPGSVAGATGEAAAGMVALSEIAPDVFELRLHSPRDFFAGARTRVIVEAFHPLRALPVAGVDVVARLDFEAGKPLARSGRTNAQGLAVLDFALPKHVPTGEAELVVAGRRRGLSARVSTQVQVPVLQDVIVSTDKTLYQPGQTLHVRALARGPGGGVLSRTPLRVGIRNDDGEVFDATVRTSRHGIASADWVIPGQAPLGRYVVHVDVGGGGYGDAAIMVSRYELPQFTVTATPDRPYYLPGDPVRIEVRADYLFGQPLTRGRVRVALEKRREWNAKKRAYDVEERAAEEGELDAKGVFTASFDLAADHARLSDRGGDPYHDITGSAWVTDVTNGRTEQRRFALRLTREPIHLYVLERHEEPCTDEGEDVCTVSFYLAASYADGTPAECEVEIGARFSYGSRDDDSPSWHLTTVRTNRYGVAEVSGLSTAIGLGPKRRPDQHLRMAEGHLTLVLTARDRHGRLGRQDEWWYSPSRVLVETPKTVMKKGEPIEARIRSRSRRGLLAVDLVGEQGLLGSRVLRLDEGMASVVFPCEPRFEGVLAVFAASLDEDDYRNHGSHSLVYPSGAALRLEMEADRDRYRPGDVARLRMEVTDRRGQPARGALGLVVLDRAVQERAVADHEFLGASGFLASPSLGQGSSLAGLTAADLLELDVSKPLPSDLDLAAEVLLYQPYGGSQRETETSRTFERDARPAYAARMTSRLASAQRVLDAVFSGAVYPEDADMVHGFLERPDVAFDALRDPWDRPYRLVIEPRGANMVVEAISDGPDEAPGTGDDLVALRFARPYFTARGEWMDRALRSRAERGEPPIRTADELTEDLTRAGSDVATWRDPWGHPFRFAPLLNGRFAEVIVTTAGPDGILRERERTSDDDVVVWVSRVEYFAKWEHEIQRVLDQELQERGTFPERETEWTEMLGRHGLDPAHFVDPWGHRYVVTFLSGSERGDSVRIAYSAITASRETSAKPVTRRVQKIGLWSLGPDGQEGTVDDFEVASFEREVVEQDSAVTRARVSPRVVLGRGEGAIVGTVFDTTGAEIPGAHVLARQGMELVRETTTDSQGRYRLSPLTVGMYDVTVELVGFKHHVVTQVPVRGGESTTLDVELEVGSLTETVSVAAQPSGLQMTSGAKAEPVAQEKGARPLMATPPLRQYFPETLLWKPEIELDGSGRAVVDVPLADSLTTWKVEAIASTDDGLVASGTRELVTFLPFFVENDPPQVLTEGDRIGLPALVRNYTDHRVDVALKGLATGGLRVEDPAEKRVTVAAGESARASFDLVAERAPEGKVRVTGTSAHDSDAVEKPVVVHPDGQDSAIAASAFVRGATALDLVVPEQAIPGSIQAELSLAPNLAAHVLESIEAVLRRPYGCTEQTISSTYPSLMALRLLGKDASLLADRARQYLDQGYRRLIDSQSASGGFAYWRHGKDDVALSAYALRFLLDAGDELEVDADVVARARSFLLGAQAADGRWPALDWSDREDASRTPQLTALVARVLTRVPETALLVTQGGSPQSESPAQAVLTTSTSVHEALGHALVYLDARMQGLEDPYLIASFALAAQGSGDQARTERSLARLRALAREEGGGSYWDLQMNTPFHGWGRAGRVETTALAVKALAASPDPADQALADRGLLFLLRQKDRYGVWWSGQATVNVLDALVTLLGETRPTAAAGGGHGVAAATVATSGALRVLVNGREVEALAVPRAAAAAVPLRLDLAKHVVPGRNHIELVPSWSGGTASVQAVARFYVPWSAATLRTSDALRLDVRFDKAEARVGETITAHVEAERVGFQGYGMLLGEIGLPPGVAVDRESLENAVAASGWDFSSYDVLPDRVVVYLWPRAGGVVFDFMLRPRFAMDAVASPSKLYDYYNPDAEVVVPPQRFRVSE